MFLNDGIANGVMPHERHIEEIDGEFVFSVGERFTFQQYEQSYNELIYMVRSNDISMHIAERQ